MPRTASVLLPLALAVLAHAAAAGPSPALPRQSAPPAPGLAPAAGGPVLRVDGEEVGAEEYARWLIENFGAKLATTFAGDWLVQKEARRRGVTVTDAELAAELERELQARIDGAFLGSKDAWLAELARTQRSEAGLRAQRLQELEIDLLTRKTVALDRVVPEEKIVREWELSYGRGGRAYDLSMLLVRCEFLSKEGEDLPAERNSRREAEIETKRQRALLLRERIVRGEPFAAVAAEASDDAATRARGGKPSPPFRHFGWPKRFLDALDELAAGDLSQPIYGKGGWWLVRVDGVVVTPLEQVRGELVRRLELRGPEQDETGNFRNALVEAAEIDVLPTVYAAPGEDLERSAQQPALVVDGETISRATYARWIQRTRGEASWPHFVEHRVVLDEARRRGVDATPAEVRERTEDYLRRVIVRDFKGNREAWIASLELKGRDVELFLHDLDVRMRIELLCERLMMLDRKVAPEDVRRRFEEVYGKDGVAVEARMILLHVPILPGPEGETREQHTARIEAAKAAVEKRARDLARTVRDGGDFAALARANSEDPASAARGGELDSRFRPEHWPEWIAKAVAPLAPGEVTDALELGPSYVILQVTGRKQVAFESVAESLRRQLESEPPPRAELSAFRNVLMKRAKVEVLDGFADARR